MERFPPDDLSPDRALDRDLVIHEARLAIHQLTERRDWAGSSRGAEHIGNALFPIFTRDYAPLEERLTSIAARLEAAPAYLAQTRTRVDAPVRLWLEIDIEGSDSLPEFLDTILAVARSEHVDPGPVARLETRRRRCAPPCRSTWPGCGTTPCRAPMARGRPGRDRFEQLVALRALDATADEILAVGEQMLAEETHGRERVSAEIDPDPVAAEVTDLVKENHPPPSRRRSRSTARPWIGRATSSSSTTWRPCRRRTGCG